MNLVHSQNVQPVESSASITTLLKTIAEVQLREWVDRISVPRHFGLLIRSFVAALRHNRTDGQDRLPRASALRSAEAQP